jgi:hypothetical protein
VRPEATIIDMTRSASPSRHPTSATDDFVYVEGAFKTMNVVTFPYLFMKKNQMNCY